MPLRRAPEPKHIVVEMKALGLNQAERHMRIRSTGWVRP